MKASVKSAAKKTGATFLDVTGKAYVEVNTFVPQYDEIGVLPPIGRWDPLQIREQGPDRYRRFVEMEIKHGRLAMAAVAGVLTTYSGIRFPGYLSTAESIKFSDIPGGAIASWAALPTSAWLQIVLFISFCEVYLLKQDPAKAAGDVVPEGWWWARYSDGYDVWLGDGSTKQVGEEELFLGKTWKLNAERNNGRAAMMGITGESPHRPPPRPPLRGSEARLRPRPLGTCLAFPRAPRPHSQAWSSTRASPATRSSRCCGGCLAAPVGASATTPAGRPWCTRGSEAPGR